MTINEFLNLSEVEQADLLLDSAVFIGKECTDNRVITVYQLESFYVKLVYKDYRKVLASVECYTSPEEVASFIEQVSIQEVIINLSMN